MSATLLTGEHAIFILEDDAQSGGDHVDAHRSFAYVMSPYSKRGVTISTNYNTVNVLRTIEDLLGIDHLNQSDANAAPRADVFMRVPDFTPYSAIIPGSLCASPVDPNLVPACSNPSAKLSPRVPELHDAAWWAESLKNFNFHEADRLDTEVFNRILWKGIMGEAPYPTVRFPTSGLAPDVPGARAAMSHMYPDLLHTRRLNNIQAVTI